MVPCGSKKVIEIFFIKCVYFFLHLRSLGAFIVQIKLIHGRVGVSDISNFSFKRAVHFQKAPPFSLDAL